MKKIILTIILTALGTIVLTAPALATTIVSLSPANINAVSGNNFNVVITAINSVLDGKSVMYTDNKWISI